MNDRDFNAERRPPKRDTVLAKFAFAWLVPAIVLTVVQLITMGKVTPLAVALDAIAAIMLPFGLLSLAIAFATHTDDGPPPEDGGGGGWGSPPKDEEPPPLGGLSIDWDKFEADFRSYSNLVTRV
jgi:hypothetical protein